MPETPRTPLGHQKCHKRDPRGSPRPGPPCPRNPGMAAPPFLQPGPPSSPLPGCVPWAPCVAKGLPARPPGGGEACALGQPPRGTRASPNRRPSLPCACHLSGFWRPRLARSPCLPPELVRSPQRFRAPRSPVLLSQRRRRAVANSVRTTARWSGSTYGKATRTASTGRPRSSLHTASSPPGLRSPSQPPPPSWYRCSRVSSLPNARGVRGSSPRPVPGAANGANVLLGAGPRPPWPCAFRMIHGTGFRCGEAMHPAGTRCGAPLRPARRGGRQGSQNQNVRVGPKRVNGSSTQNLPAVRRIELDQRAMVGSRDPLCAQEELPYLLLSLMSRPQIDSCKRSACAVHNEVRASPRSLLDHHTLRD